MSNLQRHKDCTMRSEIGNCLAIGGFCTSVSKEICEGLQNAYTNGKHSVEISEDCISRATVLEIYSDLYWMDERLLNFKDELDKIYEKLRNAPSVIPTQNNAVQHVESVEKPKEGEWISKHNGYWTCSECGLSFLFYAKGNYCPNCGSKMKGADDVER